MKIANTSLENVAKFKRVGKTGTN